MLYVSHNVFAYQRASNIVNLKTKCVLLTSCGVWLHNHGRCICCKIRWNNGATGNNPSPHIYFISLFSFGRKYFIDKNTSITVKKNIIQLVLSYITKGLLHYKTARFTHIIDSNKGKYTLSMKKFPDICVRKDSRVRFCHHRKFLKEKIKTIRRLFSRVMDALLFS